MKHNAKTEREEKQKRLNSKNTDALVDKNVPAVTRNEDPVTGETGCHPVGSGVGAAVGAAGIGAAAGTIAGPIGTVVGAIVGGIVGGIAGKAAAESVNPTVETAYWQKHYNTRPYYRKGQPFDYYRPAYQIGWESYDGQKNATWEQREPKVKTKWEDVSRWENEGGAPSMTWEEAKQAARDAHDRVARLNDSTVDILPPNRKNPR